jgi:hypothetical protein
MAPFAMSEALSIRPLPSPLLGSFPSDIRKPRLTAMFPALRMAPRLDGVVDDDNGDSLATPGGNMVGVEKQSESGSHETSTTARVAWQ